LVEKLSGVCVPHFGNEAEHLGLLAGNLNAKLLEFGGVVFGGFASGSWLCGGVVSEKFVDDMKVRWVCVVLDFTHQGFRVAGLPLFYKVVKLLSILEA